MSPNPKGGKKSGTGSVGEPASRFPLPLKEVCEPVTEKERGVDRFQRGGMAFPLALKRESCTIVAVGAFPGDFPAAGLKKRVVRHIICEGKTSRLKGGANLLREG